jgi:transposase
LRRRQPRLDPKQLVFIDEISVATNITRLYGRAPRGERLIQKVLHGNWKTTTFVAALRHSRVTAPFVLEGAMNGEMFRAYVERILAPTLKRGDIVFMDNLPVHKVAGVQKAIEGRGAILVYLPAYSPDLNPIEQVFAKLKAVLRKLAAYTLKGAAYSPIPSRVFARLSPLVLTKSLVLNVPHTSQIQDMVNLNGKRIIDEFRKLTGIPMVLNTSFNENDPVVCRPEEALDCFLRI